MQGKCAGPKWLKVDSKHKSRRWGNLHVGGHDMVRRVDPDVVQEVLRLMRDKEWDHN